MFGTRTPTSARSVDQRVQLRSSWRGPAVYLVVGGFIGFIGGRFGRSAFPNLKPTTTWDIVDVMNVLATLIIAMYLQQWAAVRGESNKAQRGHLVQLIGAVESALRELHKVVRTTAAVEGEAVTSSLKTVNGAVILLRDALTMTGATCSIAEFERVWRAYGIALGDYPWVPLSEKARIVVENQFRRALSLLTRMVLELHT